MGAAGLKFRVLAEAVGVERAEGFGGVVEFAGFDLGEGVGAIEAALTYGAEGGWWMLFHCESLG